jgi:ribosomal-protein-alanine N-acetyltransferase
MELIFYSDRCITQPLSNADKDDFIQLYHDKKTRAYLGGTLCHRSASERFQNMLADSQAYHWSVRLKSKNTFLGLIHINTHHDEPVYEISYQFLSEHWGHGYACETLKKILKDALEGLQIEKILAETQTANHSSVKLLQKLGFQHEQDIQRFNTKQSIYSFKSSPHINKKARL